MTELLYVTGNLNKIRQAAAICEPVGILLKPTTLDIVEIQAEDGEPIARDKAAKAFAALQQPLVVSDDTWIIPGLNGFPGPYASSVNKWFSVDDWVRLTKGLQDRRIILRQFVVYQDASQQKLFVVDIEGVILEEPRGESMYPHTTLTSLDGGKHSNAELNAENKSSTAHLHNVWNDFADWFTAEVAK